MVPVLSRSREFSPFLDSTGTGKNWSRKKVQVPVPEKILATVTLCFEGGEAFSVHLPVATSAPNMIQTIQSSSFVGACV